MLVATDEDTLTCYHHIDTHTYLQTPLLFLKKNCIISNKQTHTFFSLCCISKGMFFVIAGMPIVLLYPSVPISTWVFWLKAKPIKCSAEHIFISKNSETTIFRNNSSFNKFMISYICIIENCFHLSRLIAGAIWMWGNFDVVESVIRDYYMKIKLKTKKPKINEKARMHHVHFDH